jgi:hypothetical protein
MLKRLINFIRAHLRIKDGVEVISIAITALATVFMAITSCQSVKISKDVARMTRESIAISQQTAIQDLTRLQAELRPYLVPQLVPDGVNLFRDGNSEFSLPIYRNSFLLFPFVLMNVGKIPAINIKANYDSPSQKNVFFELGDSVILPDAKPTALYRPWVNISSIINDKQAQNFNVSLKILYNGNDEIDQGRNYYSLLSLTLEKLKDGNFKIIDKNFKFGIEPQEDNIQKKAIDSELKSNHSKMELNLDQTSLNFYLSFAQSLISIFAAFWIFLIFKLESEDRRLDRTYDSAKHAIGPDGHKSCLDKDVKFYFFKGSHSKLKDKKDKEIRKGARDNRIQIHNLEEIKSTLYPLIKYPIYLFGALFLIVMFIFIQTDYLLTHNLVNTAIYCILIILFAIIFIIVMKKFWILTKDTHKHVFNAPNPYNDRKSKVASTLDESDFNHLMENVDLIEREVIEFADLKFKMNHGLEKIEVAIKRRKDRFNQINGYRKSHHLSGNFLSLKIDGMESEEKNKAESLIIQEIDDRIIVLDYIYRKYRIINRQILINIFTMVENEISEHFNSLT